MIGDVTVPPNPLAPPLIVAVYWPPLSRPVLRVSCPASVHAYWCWVFG